MIGDSITAEANWNKLLLRDDVLNMGQNSEQIVTQILAEDYGLLNRIDGLDSLYEKAFLMIGINDLISEKNLLDIFNNYVALLNKIRDNRIEPIVQSILYITQNNYGIDYIIINNKVKELNHLLEEYCHAHNIEFINLNIKLSENKQLLEKNTYDGVHLSGEGYKKWVENIKKYFKIKELNNE